MKTELYVGLDVDKEWIVIAVAEWGRNGAVEDLGAAHDLYTRAEAQDVGVSLDIGGPDEND